MVSKYYFDDCKVTRDAAADSGQTVTVEQFRGVFYIIGAGILVSLICLAVQVSR